MIEDIELTKLVARRAMEACVELFQAYGITLKLEGLQPDLGDRRVLCGVIGLVGSGVRGSCMLVGDEDLIAASCPIDGCSRDWVGELTNQLAGRLKAKLLKDGTEVALSTPIGVSGVAVHPLPRNGLQPSHFTAAEGSILVWVEMDSEPDFVLPRSGAKEPGHNEGDVVLFG